MNILIVEDESYTASLLQEIIEQDNEFRVVEKLESISETVEYLSQNQKKIDLLFLDIQLADGQSFEVFKHIDIFVPVIFCTAYEEYPMQAIKSNGIDYILKPFKENEICQALQKYKKLVNNLQVKSSSVIQLKEENSRKYQEIFLTQFREKSIIINVKEIALLSVEFETLYLYTFEGQKLPLFKTLEYIESVCNPRYFFRVNRQMLVHKKSIKSFEPYSHRKIILQLHIEVPHEIIVSRLKVSEFKKWLNT